MRRMLFAFLVSLVAVPLAAAPAHASDVASISTPPECVYVEVTIPEIGRSPMVTVCRP